MAAVMGMLAAQLRTGNTLVDSLLAMLLFWLAAHMPAIRERVERWWAGRRAAGTEVTVFKEIDGTHVHATVYRALQHKLSPSVRREARGEVQLVEALGGEERWMPAKDVFAPHDHEGVRIEWTHGYRDVTAEGKRVGRGDEHLRLRCADGPALMRFITEAAAEYRAAIAQEVWAPRSYTWRGNKDGKSWEGTTVHAKRTFDTVVLAREVKEALQTDLRCFLDSRGWYADLGLDWRRGYLLHGPPGTGKTSVIRAMSTMAQTHVYSLNLAEIWNDAELREAFEDLPARCILVMEDVDGMSDVVKSRTGSSAGSEASACGSSASSTGSFSGVTATTSRRRAGTDDAEEARPGPTLSALLNLLDGVGGVHGRITVMTSNHPEVLDAALVRPGRVDLKCYLGLADRAMLTELYGLFYGDLDAPRPRPLPAGVFSPAAVTSSYLTHRGDPTAAHKYLLDQL
jgi:hypothetical protein